MTVVVVLLAVAVGVLTLIVFGLLRTHAEILRALDRAGISLDDTAAISPVGAAVDRSEDAAHPSRGRPATSSGPCRPAVRPRWP